MSTRARIALELEDGTVKSIYCHHDGYINGAGKNLFNNWDLESVAELIEGGNISGLGFNLETTVFYVRDNEEEMEDNVADIHESIDDFFEGDIEMFGYLLTSDGEWLVKENTAFSSGEVSKLGDILYGEDEPDVNEYDD